MFFANGDTHSLVFKEPFTEKQLKRTVQMYSNEIN